MTRTAKAPGFTEQQLIDMIADRFAAPAYAFLPQVRDSTGTGSARTADALAMSLWPSRGLELHGFEVKVGRNDWLRELKNPAKAEVIGQFCARWWIVAPADIVPDEEVPPLWGLLVVRGKGLVQKKAAALQPDVTPIDAPFLAAILRRAAVDCPYARRKTQEYEAGVEAGKKAAERDRGHNANELARIRERVKAFEEVSGVRIDGYDGPEKIGAAVKAIIAGDRNSIIDRADRVANSVEVQARQARQVADELALALNGGPGHG